MLSQISDLAFLAVLGNRVPPWTFLIFMIVAVATLFLSTNLFLLKHYKRCPPNRLLVIFGRTGPGDGMKLVHGGAAFVMPLLQDYAYLSLEPIDVELSQSGQPEETRLGFRLPRKFTVAIGTSADLAQTAAMRLLGITIPEIQRRAGEAIGSALARTVDSLTPTATPETNTASAVIERLEREVAAALKGLGLELLNMQRL